MAQKQGDIFITSLVGGYNDTDPITSLAPDQCAIAENVEFQSASRIDHSTVGMRRAGTEAITTPITPTNLIMFLYRHLPTTTLSDAELWVGDVTSGGATITVRYKDTTWHTVTLSDAFAAAANRDHYDWRFVTLHGKLFMAYNSGQDRLHVRDVGSTTVRRVGLAEPAAPSVGNTGAGAFSGTRYYRVRYTVQSAGTTLRRSEPSDVTTFAPSGAGSAARITKPATISENETHWEVEASLDNANFYRIATVVVGTTTYDDSVSFSVGYAATAGTVLSEDVGDYEPLKSARFLVADDDRLVTGGSYENSALSSRVAWTPVLNDPGVGNDERAPVDTDNFIDLDTFEGGGITDMGRTVNGYIYVFKWDHIYQLTRTGQRTRAYTSHCLTKTRGAVTGSVCEGVDQNGRPCLYFVDPVVGPCRIGDGGIQTCGMDIQRSWEEINPEADVVARSLFYAEASQLHLWLASGEANSPNICYVLHVNKSKQAADGIRRGWVKFSGTRAQAIATCMFSDNIEDNVARSTTFRPFIGLPSGEVHLCDTGTTDNGTAYTARIRTGPVAMNLLSEIGVMDAAVVAKAADGVIVNINVIRNFGEETKPYSVDLTPDGSEDPVIKYIDNFNISEANVIQIEFTENTGIWNIYMFAASNRKEGQG